MAVSSRSPRLPIPVFSALAFCLLAGACAPGSPPPAAPTPTPEAQTETSAPSKPLSSPPPASPTPVPSATPIPPTAAPALCSPLAEIPFAQLPDHLTNPFQPPPPGSDDPHQGIDLAVFLPGTRVGIAGDPVRAVAAGRVAMVQAGRFPYGTAVMLEVPAEAFSWKDERLFPPPQTPVSTALTCPGDTDLSFPSTLIGSGGGATRSLYILSAHLAAHGDLEVGDEVACGQDLGLVGDSGNALNPHLHLEMRLGPSGALFPAMAHYTGSASPEEQAAYCAWRVSGLFQLVDPERFLGIGD